MPTGYTADLYEGRAQTFEEFVLSCAHAFGALVLLRDEGMDSPIPTFEPQTKYDDEAIEKGLARIAEAASWTPEEATAAADADYEERLSSWRAYEAKKEAVRGRFEAMLQKVEAWKPPTNEHVELKKFMRDQLDQSISFDGTPTAFSESFGGSEHLTGEQHQANIIQRAEKEVTRARQHRAEEIERTASRNAWVTALRDSLAARSEV